MPLPDRPTRPELETLLRNLAPEIARIFRRHGVPEEEACILLGQALAALARRWGTVKSRERWFLRTLATGAKKQPPAAAQ